MLENIKKFWVETMEIDAARWVIWSTLLLILVIVAIYIVKFFRDQAFGSGESGDGSLLDEIRRWKQSGVVDEDEFAQVHQVAAQRVRQELIGGRGLGADSSTKIENAQPKPRPKTLAEMQALKQAASQNPAAVAVDSADPPAADRGHEDPGPSAVESSTSQVSNDPSSPNAEPNDVEFREEPS